MSGFKLSLAPAKNKHTLKPSTTSLAKRPRLTLDDDEPEDTTKSVEISGWDTTTGGAIDLNGKKKEEETLRVIKSAPNRSLRDQVQRKRAANGEESKNVEQYQESGLSFGLNTFKKDDAEKQSPAIAQDTAPEPQEGPLTEEERLNKQALNALLNGNTTDEYAVIPVRSEEEAFREDVEEAPDAPSLDAYDATPIEGFGAALLRGMGWKDGEELGRNKDANAKPREIKRRPALLGIGAKDEAAVGIELGEWGQGKGKGKRKVDQAYNPVIMRNKNTGELVSQEELQKKLETQGLLATEGDAKRARDGKSAYDDAADESVRRRGKDRRSRREGSSEEDGSERRRERRHRDKRDRERRDRSGDEDERRRDRDRDRDRRDRSRDDRRRDAHYDDERRRDRRRERRDRSESPGRSYDSDDRRRKRRDREYDEDPDDRKRRDGHYDDERGDRKRRHRHDDDRRYRK